MSNKTQPRTPRHERKVSASRLRRLLADMAEDITAGIDTITLSARGNTLALHLQGAVINITINHEKGGEHEIFH